MSEAGTGPSVSRPSSGPTAGVEELDALLDSFQGAIVPARVSWLYQAGLAVAALVMVLLPLVYIGLIGLAAFGVFYHATQNTGILMGSGGTFWRLMVYGAPIVAGSTLVLFMIKPLFARRPREVTTLTLTAEEEPVLFGFIERICESVRAPFPRQVVVNCDVNASASFRRGLASLLGNDLTLTIGLPLAGGLSMREFGGVLAHEFGHFAQGAGMRLSYLIRLISYWFARVVFERDQWDVSLEQAASNTDWRIAVVLHAARACVWLSRRVLWALMRVGQAVSCFLLRQMEYDADSYECQLAGSDSFDETMGRLRTLAVAWQSTFGDLQESWQNRRLPDNLPLFISHKADSFTPDVRGRIEAVVAESKTRMFDTHPCDRDRLRAAEALGAPGVFRRTDPARALFRDFEALSKRVTRTFYEQEQSLPLEDQSLIATEESLAESAALAETQAALQEYFLGINTVFGPVLLTSEELKSEADPEETRSALRLARRQLEERKEVTAQAWQKYLKADQRCTALSTAFNLREAGFTLKSGFLELSPADLAKPAEALSAAHRERQTYAPPLESFAQAAKARLGAALQLLHRSPALDLTPVRRALQQEATTLVQALERIGRCLPALHEIRRAFPGLELLVSNRESHPNPGRVDVEVRRMGEEFRPLVEQIRDHLKGSPYPFQHARGQITLDQFAWVEKAAEDELSAIFQQAHIQVGRLFPLYDRVLGRLAFIARQEEANDREGA